MSTYRDFMRVFHIRQGDDRYVIGGSQKLGPSDDYRALLAGEIDSAEYVRRVKAEVAARTSGRAKA